MRGNDGAMLRDGEGEKLRDGAKLRDGEGATRMRVGAMLRGSTRTRSGTLVRGSTRMRSGALVRGSTRMRSGALLRGCTRTRSGALSRGPVHEEEGGRRASRVKSRASAGTRGEELLRRRGSVVLVTRWRVPSTGAKRLGDKRCTLGGGAVRTAGTALGGTRAAETAGPRGAREGPTGGGAGRTPGVAAVRCEGCAGSWYGGG